jgi:hypothetical protein
MKIMQNNPKYKSIKQTLEKAITDYHNHVIIAADVIRMMIKIKKGMDMDTRMRFNGVATKYLQHYLAWFRYLDSKEYENTTSNKKI